MMPDPIVRMLLGATLLAAAAPAQAMCRVSACAPDALQASGAVYRVCTPEPSCWNGDLVVFAHAFVESGQPIAIPDNQLVLDGVSLPRLANALGYAFAVTSYSANGLATREGIADVVDLVGVFTGLHGPPGRTYLLGASEGAQVAVLALEQHPDVFDAGLAACGPIGDFQGLIDDTGDFRSVFDYFFPGVFPGTAVDVPVEVRREWEAVFVPRIRQVLAENPAAVDELLAVTGAAFDGAVPSSREVTVLQLLAFGAFAGMDTVLKLGGSPFDNTGRQYRGSRDDFALNRGVRRYAADASARDEVAAHYETSGRLARPLVTLHNRRDPLAPHRQSVLYARKAREQGAGALHTHIPVFRFGHCAFTAFEGLVAFGTMIHKAGGLVPPGLERAQDDRRARSRLLARARVAGR